MRISELLPEHARVADRFTVVRSLAHTGFCHQQGNQQMFTGHPELVLKLKPDHPDLMCVANRLRSDPSRRLPTYVGVNPIPYLGPAYLGPEYEPFSVYGDPNAPEFRVPELGPRSKAEVERMGRRVGLASRFDGLRRALDDPAQAEAFDSFQRQAFTLLDRSRGTSGVRPGPRRSPSSAIATAETPGASAAFWPAGWSRPAWTW